MWAAVFGISSKPIWLRCSVWLLVCLLVWPLAGETKKLSPSSSPDLIASSLLIKLNETAEWLKQSETELQLSNTALEEAKQHLTVQSQQIDEQQKQIAKLQILLQQQENSLSSYLQIQQNTQKTTNRQTAISFIIGASVGSLATLIVPVLLKH